MKFLVHIGQPKTGTTSLQVFLHTNRDLLVRSGIAYPRAGIRRCAHHDLSLCINQRHMRSASATEQAELTEAMNAFRTETAGGSCKVLVSSEGFRNCNPKWVAEHFAPERTAIVVYIREQVEYLVSSYQQRVHATGYSSSLSEYVAKSMVDYDAFLTQWERMYGRKRMRVRVYDRTRLADGDIIADFGQVIGLDLTNGYQHPVGDQNPSIGGALLELKRRINHGIGRDGRTVLPVYNALSRLAGGDTTLRRKPTLPPAEVARIRDRSRMSNRRVFERHFGGDNVFGACLLPSPGHGEPIDDAQLAVVAAKLECLAPDACRTLCREAGVETLGELTSTGHQSANLVPNLY